MIVNARAGRARRDPGLAGRLRAVIGADAVIVTRAPDEVAPALAALRERGTDTLLLVGGDGSVTGTLTPLLRGWPADALPALALTRGGTVNTIAKSLGSAGAPERVAARLLRAAGGAVRRRRAVVRVVADDGEPVFGMIFVNGVGVRFLDVYHDDSSRGVVGALSVIARVAGSAVSGGQLARSMFAPFRAELVVDGEALPAADYTVMAAAGIRDIGLGFAPFYTAGRDPEHIHLAVCAAGALSLVRELPALRLGRRLPGSVLSHFSPRQAVIRTDEPEAWTLDAESFAPARALRLEAGPVLDFVSTGGRFG